MTEWTLASTITVIFLSSPWKVHLRRSQRSFYGEKMTGENDQFCDHDVLTQEPLFGGDVLFNHMFTQTTGCIVNINNHVLACVLCMLLREHQRAQNCQICIINNKQCNTQGSCDLVFLRSNSAVTAPYRIEDLVH